MKRMLLPLFFAPLGFLLISCSRTDTMTNDDRLFELRTYYPNPGKLEDLHARFRNHTLELFERQGIENIGYWVTDEPSSKLVYLLAFEDKKSREAAWDGFLNDPEWKAVYAESTKNGRIVSRIDSVLLELTDYSPAIVQEQASPERAFELRTYKTTEGNLDNLDARFRDHTIGLFAKHGASNLFYFHIVEGEEGYEDTLVYFLSHESKASRDKMFEDFRADPDWVKARAASEEAAGGSLTQPGGVISQMLKPTDYSKIK